MVTSVRSILAAHYSATINSISYQEKVKLTQKIRSEVKAAIGHGVSKEYYDRHWSFYAINPKYINKMIVNAKFKQGAWADSNVLKPRILKPCKKKKAEDKDK